jgi:hypothetical protein
MKNLSFKTFVIIILLVVVLVQYCDNNIKDEKIHHQQDRIEKLEYHNAENDSLLLLKYD